MGLETLSPAKLIALSLLAGLTFQLLLGTSYVAAFLDPVPESIGVPVALVNADAGTRGDAVVARFESADSPVTWVAVATETEARAGLDAKRYMGALVIPANFSANLASFGTLAPEPAHVHTYTNAGASTTGSIVASRTIDAALARLRERVQEEAIQAMTPAGPGVGAMTLAQARYVANPVIVTETQANAIPPNGVNGLAPAYLVSAAWMGGYLGSVALERFKERTRLTAPRRLLIVTLASIAQAGFALAALAVIGFAMPDPGMLFALLALGTLFAYTVVGLLLDAFGLVGIVPAFALLAIGLPASGAIYPTEMLPPFYRAIHDVNPFTWLADAVRTVSYTPQAGDVAGGAAAIAVVIVIAVAATLVIARSARR